MKHKWHLLVPVCALLFQPVPILFIRIIAWTAYGESRWLPESWVWTVSLLGLSLCATASMVLGSLGVYALLTRSRPVIAIVLIVLCCIPALIGGAVYLRAVLVFLTLV